MHNGVKKLMLLGCALVGIFMLIGLMRTTSGSSSEEHAIDKLLYFTDGSRVTNGIMKMYPDGTFPLEYGKCEFLSNWLPSPMKTRYYSDISDNIGLIVTVTSSLPSLYFDFGFTGGIIMWGIFCFMLELIALNLLKRDSILAFFLAVQLTRMFYQSPIGEMFGMSISSFEWLSIMYIFRNRLFNMPKQIT